MTAAHLGRARSLIKLHEWMRAESDLKITPQDDDKRVESLALLSKIYQAQGQPEKAADSAAKAAQLSSDDLVRKATNNQIAAELANAHALTLHNQNMEAARAYEKIVHEHPEVSAAWFYLGSCYAEIGRLANSESALRHYLSAENESAAGHLLLGRVLLREKQSKDARGEFIHAKEIDPLLTEAWIGIAASYIVENNFPEAIKTLRAAASLAKSNAGVHLMLTEALYKNRQKDKALDEIDRLLKQDPSNERAQRMRKSMQRN